MIETLTKKQEALIPKVRDQWLNQLFSCKVRTNQTKATKAITWLYKLCGYEKPTIVFLSSPLACQFGCNYVKNVDPTQVTAQVWAQVGAQVGAQVRAQVWDQVWAQVGAQVRAQVWDQVWDQVGAQVRAQVWAQVWDQVGAQVRAQVWDQVVDQVKANKMEFFGFASYGSIYDYGWVSFYEYFKTMKKSLFKKNTLERFNNFVFLLKSGIYDMVQFEKIVFVSDMPVKIHRNAENRLHNANGYAIEWSDGFGLYFINGVAFNEKLYKKVTSPKVTPQEIFSIENMEQRRVAYEIMDKTKMKKIKGKKVLDVVKDDGYGYRMELIDFPVKGFTENFRYLRCFCPSTSREYFLQAQGFNTCMEAKLGSFGLQKIVFDKEF